MAVFRCILVVFALFLAVNISYVTCVDNCTLISDCDNCTANHCYWVQCQNIGPACQDGPTEFCNEVPCNDTPTTTTEQPETTTTTEVPTTEIPTTEIPTTSTTETPTTTEVPTTPPTTPAPDTTTLPPTTIPPTELPTTTPTPKPPPPSGRHFDAASFFGGMVLAIGIIAVAFAAWRFYKSRHGQSYHTLESVC